MPTPRRYANHAQRQAAYRRRQAQARKEELADRTIPAAPPIATMPGWQRWNAITERLLLLLNTMHDEMHDYYDQRSDAWQESQRADAFSERLQAVEDAICAVEALSP